MDVTLYVSSLPDDATPSSLAEQFVPFGTLLQKIQLRKKAGLLFGFVTLRVEDEAGLERCIAALHNSLWGGHRMRVERAKSNPDAERQQTFLKKFEEKQAVVAAAAAVAKEAVVKKVAAPQPVKRALNEPVEEEAQAAAPKKRKKKPTREAEERKVRVRPVADVAKATPWDTVLGHAWEERHENAFSLLPLVGDAEAEVGAAERRLESVATRTFARDVKRETREEEAKKAPNPRLASFLKVAEGDQAQATAPASVISVPAAKTNASVSLNFGESFMRDENEVEKLLDAWREERHELRKDYKAKKRRSDKSAKTSQKRRP